MTSKPSSQDALARLATVIESRKAMHGGDANASYVARLLQKGRTVFSRKLAKRLPRW